MCYPKAKTVNSEIDLKLGIKSSLPNAAQAIALLYLIWKCNDKKSTLEYSLKRGDRLVLRPDIQGKIINLLQGTISHFEKNLFEEKILTNPLLIAQIEHLIVGFELIWKLAKFEFTDGSAFSIERTGGIRYEKIIRYTSNIDVLDLLILSNEKDFLEILYEFIIGKKTQESKYANSLKKLLTIFSETAVYKIKTDSGDLIFDNLGIYKSILENITVDLTGVDENKGSSRILKSSITEGLNYYLSAGSGGFVKNTYLSVVELKDYAERVENFLSLTQIRMTFDDKNKLDRQSSLSSPRSKHILSHDQTIFYGVPGCGKSNKIKSILDEAERGGKISDKDEQVVRVVFHPEYTNADFIGQIVPKRDKDGHIDYSFETGPFAKILRRAYLNPEKPYYLIVEEVNRGNAAAIFGDMFQLLDRFGADGSEETNSNTYGEGWSAYSVNNADINWYIRNGADKSESGEQNAAVEVISNTTENPYSEIKVGGIAISANTGLRLPPNLSILGTMNTSDQNVFTLDNAFQRRWNLVLIENDFPDEGDETWNESVRAQRDAKIEGTEVSWNTFRTEINKIIAQEAVSTGLSSMEDKRLGCWFVKNTGGEISKELFANKVLKYLWDDAFKFSRPKVFGPYTTFEEVRKDFVGSKAFSVFSIKLAGINGGIPADGQSQDERQEN